MNKNIKNKTISSLFWKLTERGGASIVMLVVQIVMARLLAPDMFGALAIMLVFVNIGNVIVTSGLNTALVQNPTTSRKDCSTVFWLSLSISIVLYVLIFLFAPSIATFYNSDELIAPLRVLSLILIINSYNAVQIAIVQRELEFKKIFKATIASVIVSGVLGISAALLNFGLWALVIQQLSYQLLNCIALAFQVTWHPRFVFDIDRAKELFGFGWKLLVSGLMEVGYQSLSDLIVGKQFSQTQLGYVSQGKKYPQAISSMLDGSIQPVMLSAVSHIQDDIKYVKRLVRRALKTSTYLIMPCMTCFALVAEPFVKLFLGEQWLPSVYFLQIYCFVFALIPIHTSNLQALNAMGRSDLFLKLEIIKKSYGLVFILVTAFVFHNVYLLVGSYLITSVISTFVNAYPNKKVIGYSYFEQLKDIAPSILLSVLSAAIAFPISFLALPEILTIIIQAITMFCVYILFSKLFHIEEFTYLINTAKDIITSKTK